MLRGLTKEGLEKWQIDGLLEVLDMNKDGEVSRDEWTQAWTRSVVALGAAGNKGHNDIKSIANVLTVIMKRPKDVDFKDLHTFIYSIL